MKKGESIELAHHSPLFPLRANNCYRVVKLRAIEGSKPKKTSLMHNHWISIKLLLQSSSME